MREDARAIASLASAVARVWKAGVRDIVIVHGAGSFGHAPVLKYGLNCPIRTEGQKAACALTNASCARLSSLVVQALLKKGVPAISLAPCALIISSNKRISSFNTKPIKEALKSGYVPVLYGDMVPDKKLCYSVCSGDQIISYLGKRASRIVMATNVDGVLAGGKVVPLITRRNFAKIAPHLRESGKPDVTGGMAGKIKEIMKCRCPSHIVNARKPDRVAALLLGKKAVSTKIVP
jgi:isopentenyl phosphate kinase